MPVNSACADRDEPRDHHRTERPSDDGGAVPLDVEQHDDDDDGDRHDPFLEVRVDDFDAFDGGQHGDRGVIMLSPKNRAAPKTPSAASISAVRRPSSTPIVATA